MRGRQTLPWTSTGVFCLIVGLTVPGQASMLARFFAYLHPSSVTRHEKKSRQPGQDVRAFKLSKAKAADLLVPIENYLDNAGKTATGDVQVREADNALVVTDFPDNLNRLAVLISDIDQSYDNPNPMARQMLATQALMKSIRNRGMVNLASAAPSRRPSGTSSLPPAESSSSLPLPLPGSLSRLLPSIVIPSSDEEDMRQAPVRRWVASPTLQQFQVVGWMRDDSGYTVVLSNEGSRFVYRAGRLHCGYDPRSEPVEGIRGMIQNNRLILIDRMGQVSLKMMKWRDL